MKKWAQNFTRSHPQLSEIMRFLIVGGLATVVDFFAMGVVLYCFNPLLYSRFYDIWFGNKTPTPIATIIGTGTGFIAGLIFNYLCSVLFVFQEKGQSRSVKGFLLFTVLALSGLLIHLGGMYIGYDLLHINEWIIKTCLTLIVLIYNYITRKIFIFKTRLPQLPNTDTTQQKW